MSKAIHACVIIHPAPGKENRLKELLVELGDKTKEDEKDCLKYQFFEHINPETKTTRYVLEEIWPNQASLDAHFASPHFISIVTEICPAEGLFAQPLDMMVINPIAGFASR